MIYIFTGGPSAGKTTACKTLVNLASCFKHVSFDFCTEIEWTERKGMYDVFSRLVEKVRMLYSSRHSIVIDVHAFMLPLLIKAISKFCKAFTLTVIRVPDTHEALQRHLANPEWGTIDDTNIKYLGLVHHYLERLKAEHNRLFIHTSEFSPLSWTIVFNY